MNKIVKRFMGIVICFVFLVSLSFSAEAAKSIQVVVDGIPVKSDVDPIIIDGRTLLPVRAIFEEMGLKVIWNKEERKIQGEKEDIKIWFKLDSTVAFVNTVEIALDTPPKSIRGRAMVPVRFIAEATGAEVRWDSKSKTVYIQKSKNTLEKDNASKNMDNTSVYREEEFHSQADPIEKTEEALDRSKNRVKKKDPLDGKLTMEELEKKYHIQENTLTEKEKNLIRLVQEYRRSIGKKEFRISKSLTKVARYHTLDSNVNRPEEQGAYTNLHSWSDKGPWKAVGYTPDHAHKELMWSKPRELTKYKADGYEISSWSSLGMTPEKALDLWKHSSGHNAILKGEGVWENLNVMGVAIEGEYAHIWFGSQEDPDGYYDMN